MIAPTATVPTGSAGPRTPAAAGAARPAQAARAGGAPPTGTPVPIASIVLSWNQRALTLACLDSLAAMDVPPGVDHRVVVVDNGSTDGSADAVRAAHPDVTVVALPTNRGFAGGANVGVRRALDDGAAWTLLVNNDTLADARLLCELYAGAAVAELAPAAVPGRRARRGPLGLVAPTVLYHDPPGVVWPSAGFRRRWTLAARDTTARPPARRPYDIDWANGCCVLVRRALWERVGLFDERYGVYYEDHDLCLRARAAGFRLAHVPGARITHRVAASTGPGSPAQAFLLARSSVPYYLAHSRGAHRAFVVAYRLVSLALTWARSVAAGRPDRGLAYARGLAAGWRDVRTAQGLPR